MTNEEIYSHVDYTLLKPFATWEDIVKLVERAISLKTASVCVPPSYVKRIHDMYEGRVKICTVIGFPLGYSVTESKLTEAREAIKDGADEIDMVINIADLKNGDYFKVENEIRSIKEVCQEKILKVIVETCYLNEEEKIRLSRTVTNAGADYIKTSTGFGTKGADLEDIKIFKENIGPNVKIKAAGAIREREAMINFINAGADRIGASNLEF